MGVPPPLSSARRSSVGIAVFGVQTYYTAKKLDLVGKGDLRQRRLDVKFSSHNDCGWWSSGENVYQYFCCNIYLRRRPVRINLGNSLLGH